jgi:predicted dienelactone hydrolase
MRPLELSLVLVNLLTLGVLAVSQLHPLRWTGYVAFIAVVIAIAQMIVEGPRWQMVPAYVLTGLFFLVWQLQSTTLAGKPVNRLAAGLAIGLGTLALVISAALPIVSPVFRFPRPTGPYAIGTLTYHWVDAARPEVFTADPNDHRELMVQVWYPALASPSAPRAPYVQDARALAPGLAGLAQQNAERLFPGFSLTVPSFPFTHLKYITTNAIPSAPVAQDESSYPVLIFIEGLNGLRQMNTFQVEELVSHGYIVAAIDQPYAATEVVFPDGRRVDGLSKDQLNVLLQQSISPVTNAPTLNGQTLKDGIIPYFAQDAVFTLHQLASLNQADPAGILTGHLDVQRAGVFGVSLGGIVGAEACHLEHRFRACLVREAPMPADVVKSGLQQPSMWITSDADTWRLQRWSDRDVVQHQTMRAVFESLPGDGYLARAAWISGISSSARPASSSVARHSSTQTRRSSSSRVASACCPGISSRPPYAGPRQRASACRYSTAAPAASTTRFCRACLTNRSKYAASTASDGTASRYPAESVRSTPSPAPSTAESVRRKRMM